MLRPTDYGVLVVAWAWPDDIPAARPEDWRKFYYVRFSGAMFALHFPMRQEDIDADSSKRHSSQATGVTFLQFGGLEEQGHRFCSAASTNAVVNAY